MALDAICLRALAQELRAQIVGLRVEKVQQPTKEQVVLVLRGNRRLLLRAGGSQAGLRLTQETQENPASPPMFCMLLRKHLQGGRITAVLQPNLERLVELHLQVVDELGETGERRLILEAMGRRSNLILLDGEGRILDCLRRVDFEMSAQRALLPGLFYQYPRQEGKLDPLCETREAFLEAQACAEGGLDRWLQSRYCGMSPLLARELVHRSSGRTDAAREELLTPESLWQSFSAQMAAVEQGAFVPLLLRKEGALLDFSAYPVEQYGTLVTAERQESFCALLDAFFGEKERLERNRQRGQTLRKAATVARDRTVRKLALRRQEYQQTQERERLRLYGELITANLWRMERGERELVAENYYEESLPKLTIPLDPLLTPQENAARYYKQYTKARTAERYLRELIAQGETELRYLESVLEELERAENEQDFTDIRHELQDGGYLRREGKKERKLPPSKPREYRTASGFRILVGRSNQQNDRLTCKLADKRDIWFHVQKSPGSHVILCTAGQTPDDESIRQAASLAAYYSQAKESGSVPVDYTPVRYVKKPVGSKPGMVVYETYRTLFVRPSLWEA